MFKRKRSAEEKEWRYKAMRNAGYVWLTIGFLVWGMKEYGGGSGLMSAAIFVSGYLFIYFTSLVWYGYIKKNR